MAMTKKQKRYLNIGMVAIAALIVVAGVYYVLSMRGAVTPQAEAQTLTVSAKSGMVNVERGGLSMSLDKGSALQDGDQIETLDGASAELDLNGAGTFVLSSNAKLTVRLSDTVGLELESGDAYVDAQFAGLSIETPQGTVLSDDLVSALSVPGQTSAQLQVLAGTATDSQGDSVSEETTLDLYQQQRATTTALAAKQLSDFALQQARASIEKGRTLCFSDAQLSKVQEQRARAKEKSEAKAQAKTENAQKDEDAQESSSSNSSSAASSGSSKAGASKPSSSVKKKAKRGKGQGRTEKGSYVTIEVRCDTILDNMDALADGKEKYVPSDGTVIAKTKVEIASGDTVFDVLKAVCKEKGVSLEYSSSDPLYSGVFVDSISHLATGDCGDVSGWIYRVNGYEPNYTCSKYKLKNGDSILWGYTCKDYGNDVK